MEVCIESLKDYINENYYLEDIIETYVSDFDLTHHSFNHFKIYPDPLSGSERGLSLYLRNDGEDEFYRHSMVNTDVRFKGVSKKGTAYNLLNAVFSNDTPMLLVERLRYSGIPKRSRR